MTARAVPPPEKAAVRQAGPVEERLRSIFSDVLLVDDVGLEDSIYDLGGNSLLAGEVAGRIRAELGVDLSLGDVLEGPSVAELAARILGARPARPSIVPRMRPAEIPASYPQRSLWLIDQMEGPSPRYNEPFALRLRGPISVQALRDALGDLVGRHESLRTTIVMGTDEPVQAIMAPSVARAALRLQEIATSESQLPALLTTLSAGTFDLGNDLPLRAFLCHVDTDTHVLLLLVHHVAVDGASLRPMWDDLALAYNARLHSAQPSFSPLPVQYADFALWQRDVVDSPAGADDIRFWREELAGLPALSGPPTNRPRTADRRPDADSLPIRIGRESHEALVEAAVEARTTVFTLVHAALVAVLRQQGAGPDLAIGAVVACRGDEALADLVGFVANTVVLRTDTAGATSFAELVDRARTADRAALTHEEVPFERVVDVVGPERSLAYHPLVQVFLAFQVQATAGPVFAGLAAEPQPVETKLTKFDLCLDIVERFGPTGDPDGLEGRLDYAVDIFDRETVELMRDALMALLRQMSSDLSAPLPRVRPS